MSRRSGGGCVRDVDRFLDRRDDQGRKDIVTKGGETLAGFDTVIWAVGRHPGAFVAHRVNANHPTLLSTQTSLRVRFIVQPPSP